MKGIQKSSGKKIKLIFLLELIFFFFFTFFLVESFVLVDSESILFQLKTYS